MPSQTIHLTEGSPMPSQGSPLRWLSRRGSVVLKTDSTAATKESFRSRIIVLMFQRSRKIATTAGALLALSVAMLPATALGLGNNRTVYRSCGANYVSSGYYAPGGYSWAQTLKHNGNCAGPLSVALRYSNGYQTPRAYGGSFSAYTSWRGSAQYGLHWGCNTCNVTYS